jgi:hypothetical protein
MAVPADMQTNGIVRCGGKYSGWWATTALAQNQADGGRPTLMMMELLALCMPADLSTSACQRTCDHLHINPVLHGLLNGVFGVGPAAAAAAAAASELKQC